MKRLIISIVVILVLVGIAMLAISEYLKSRLEHHPPVCIYNLRIIDGAKEQAAMELNLPESATVSVEQIKRFIKQDVDSLKCDKAPKRSFNESYSLERIGSKPLCLIHPSSHTLIYPSSHTR
jgi:hypothetical protein